MPEPTSEQLADLDFEGGAQAIGPTGAVVEEPAESQPPVTHDLAEAGFGEHGAYQPPQLTAEHLERLQELAYEDPLAAAAVLTEVRMAEMEHKLREQYAPLVHDLSGRRAEETVTALEQEYGSDVFEEIKPALAKAIARYGSALEDPATGQPRMELLRAISDSLVYRGGPPIDHDALIKATMDGYAPQRDTFGTRASGGPAEGVSIDAYGNVVDRSSGRRLSPHEVREVVRLHRTAYVEGGSGPQPPAAHPDVDPVIAAMDVALGTRDAFGRIPGRGGGLRL